MSKQHDAHILSGAYALDAVTPEEAELVEAAMRESEDLRSEVVGLVDTAVTLGLAVQSAAPPAALRARLLAAIEDLPQESDPVDGGSDSTEQQDEQSRLASRPHVAPRRRRRARRPAVLVALAAVAVLLFSGGVLVQRAVLQPQTDYAAISAAADVQRSAAAIPSGGRVLVEWSAEENGTAVVLNGVDVPSGRALQLWTVRDDDSITSEGLYQPQGDAGYAVLEGVPGAGEQLAVSVEPQGGSDQPTTEPIVFVPLRT